MSLLASYLRRQYKLLLLLAGFFCIFAAVFSLYTLPVEAVAYAGLLCFLLGLALFAVGYACFRSRHRELQRLLRQVQEKVLPLPPARGLLEEDYQSLVQALCRDRARLALEVELLKIEQYVEMVLSYLRLDSDSTDYVLRDCQLDEILRQAVRKLAKMFILKKITLDFQETGKTVLTDGKWLAFVVEQVLSNALKYTPEGGTIRIYGDGDTVVISDSGIGIQPEDLPRVFEKGFTGYNGRTERKSTGIGLYLCRQVLQRLCHGITITSRPGQGTLVRLDLSRRQRVME